MAMPILNETGEQMVLRYIREDLVRYRAARTQFVRELLRGDIRKMIARVRLYRGRCLVAKVRELEGRAA